MKHFYTVQMPDLVRHEPFNIVLAKGRQETTKYRQILSAFI
jgi:hypothetical protein